MFMAFECFIPIVGDDFGAKKDFKLSGPPTNFLFVGRA